MKIVDGIMINEVKFKDIKDGDVFSFFGIGFNDYYIKIPEMAREYKKENYKGCYNAIDLKTGDPDYFDEDTLVISVNAKLVIE